MVSLLIIIALFLVINGAIFFYWHRQVRSEVDEGAEISWQHYREHDPDFLGDLSREEFHKTYALVHTPRFPAYAFGALASFLLSLPIIFALLSLFMWGAQATGIVPEPIDMANRYFIRDGQLVLFRDAPPEAALYYIRDLGGFYYFFGVLASWLLIVWGFTRHYHRNRPGYLREEIIRAKEKKEV